MDTIVGKIQDKGEDRFIIIKNNKNLFKVHDLKTKLTASGSYSSISEASEPFEKLLNNYNNYCEEKNIKDLKEIEHQKIKAIPQVDPEREKKIENIFEKIHELFDFFYKNKDYTVFNSVPLWELLMLNPPQRRDLKRLYNSKLYESLVLTDKQKLYSILYGILHAEGPTTGEHHHFDYFSEEKLFPFKITFSSNRLPEDITKNMSGGGNDEQIGKEFLMSLYSEDFEEVYINVMERLNPRNWMYQ